MLRKDKLTIKKFAQLCDKDLAKFYIFMSLTDILMLENSNFLQLSLN